MDRRKFLFSLPLAVAGSSSVSRIAGTIARQSGEKKDELICARKFELAVSQSLQRLPVGEVMVQIGKTFIGTEYVAHTLEVPGEERLVVNLRGLDCVSFCENVLVFARCIKKNRMTFDEYKKELQWIRYRGGVIDGYPSRLHYFTDYIYDNVKKGVWKDVTKEIGGVPIRMKINFMSTHPQSYRQLTEHPEFVNMIEAQEVEISQRKMYYLPKEAITDDQNGIQSGDILAVTTDIEGLDISHTGVAVRENGRVHLMHAPDVGHNVTISEKSLSEYLASHKRQTGVMVARPLEPLS